MSVKILDSMSSFLDKVTCYRYDDAEWQGESFYDALQFARNGDDSEVLEAEKLLDLIESTSEGDDIRAYQASPMGAFVVVPEYLAGFPMPMRMLEATGEKSPIKIAVCVTCSGSLDKETMRKRGIAILALVMRLQRIRPVELLLVNTLGSKRDKDDWSLLAVPLDSKPVSLAHAAFALTNVAFARALCYNYAYQFDNANGGWPASYGNSDYENKVKKALGLGTNDLWIKDAHAYDKLVSNPVEWINAQVAKFNVGTDNE